MVENSSGSAPRSVAVLKDLLRIAFPSGTATEADFNYVRSRTLLQNFPCPDFPPDLFGYCGTLLQWSGAYSLFCPGGQISDDAIHSYEISSQDLRDAADCGRQWRRHPDAIPDRIVEWWSELSEHGDANIYVLPSPSRSAPNWWRIAYLLFIAADEAAFGVGRYSPDRHDTAGAAISWVDDIVRTLENADRTKGGASDSSTPDASVVQITPRVQTIAIKLNKDVACVQAKSKTPGVGCTLRTLSNNLALLPHRGQIRVHWQRPPTSDLGNADRSGLNLLLIPYPYKMADHSFEPKPLTKPRPPLPNHEAWDWFELRQTWLPRTSTDKDLLCKFVSALIKKAIERDGQIHGVIFPELALNWDLYKEIAEMIRREFPSIELLVSGSKDNCAGDEGNYVISSNFYDDFDADADTARRVCTITSRPKHHRWKLDANQLKAYKITNLDPEKAWWEGVHLPPRELHVNVFREGNIFTTLICEDLARSEPCHDVLRSIGPNLVFVLLMDGPQLPERWSARYSTGLSDDPGSSVLTITSRALVEAYGRDLDSSKRSWSIGLWKDDVNIPIPIDCPPGAQATTLKLSVEKQEECSFDGRVKTNPWSWRVLKTPDATGGGFQCGSHIDISDEHGDLVEMFCPEAG